MWLMGSSLKASRDSRLPSGLMASSEARHNLSPQWAVEPQTSWNPCPPQGRPRVGLASVFPSLNKWPRRPGLEFKARMSLSLVSRPMLSCYSSWILSYQS